MIFEYMIKCKKTTDQGELIRAYMEWEEGRPKETGLYLTVAEHSESELNALGVTELLMIDLRDEQ